MYYFATVKLGWSHKDFWNSTPSCLFNMMCVHKITTQGKASPSAGGAFADEVF